MQLEISILENAYLIAEKMDTNIISATIKMDIDPLIARIDDNKSIISALATSLLKKIITPSQDCRLHRADFLNGYSARTLDTQITTPFFKSKFPRYANKETGFLTLATREAIKWTKSEGQKLKIRNKDIKNNFLNILDNVENSTFSANDYLQYLFYKLIQVTNQNNQLIAATQINVKSVNILNINKVLEMLETHFSTQKSSRLPVIAIYSIYEILLPQFQKYQDKILKPLQPHTASDKHGFGDIELYTAQNEPYEIIEIKHNIPIDKNIIFDVVKKINTTPIYRYYVLTTYNDSFGNAESKKEVEAAIFNAKQMYGIDIIANGIVTTIKYYLRFVEDYKQYIEIYTKNLREDASKSADIKPEHLNKWNDIINP